MRGFTRWAGRLWDMRRGAGDVVAGKTTGLWRLSTLWEMAVGWRWRGFAVLLFIFSSSSFRETKLCECCWVVGRRRNILAALMSSCCVALSGRTQRLAGNNHAENKVRFFFVHGEIYRKPRQHVTEFMIHGASDSHLGS